MNEHISRELIDQVIDEFTRGQPQSALDFIAEYHPADIALLMSYLDEELFPDFIALLEEDKAAQVVVELDDPYRELLLRHLTAEELAPIVDDMESDEAADVVQDLTQVDEEAAEELLQRLGDEQRDEVDRLLEYDEDSAGGIMAVEFVAVNINLTVDDAIREIRRQRDCADRYYQVFVVDDNYRLVGHIALQDLVMADDSTPLLELVEKEVLKVTPDTDQERVAYLAQKYDLITVAVVDDQDHLLGRITPDDILDVMQEEAAEDLAAMAGTGQQEVSDLSSPRIARQRLPWLIFGLGGGICAAWIMSVFEHSLYTMMHVAFFVPVVIAMGGNIGIQSSSIVVRSLALEEELLRQIPRRLWVELKVSIINALILSVLLFGAIYLWQRNLLEAFAIAGSLVVVIVFAAFVGTLSPLVLEKLNIDPALATGPFITISNDVTGLLIYLFITTRLLL
ncbi:MAG: magnesium transporter [Candidatus Delongbacteria bacterium]|nr:magnesium transporter [Candidatus Delongbacteria bacterium]